MPVYRTSELALPPSHPEEGEEKLSSGVCPEPRGCVQAVAEGCGREKAKALPRAGGGAAGAHRREGRAVRWASWETVGGRGLGVGRVQHLPGQDFGQHATMEDLGLDLQLTRALH